jgi:hypothetical protein
MASIFLLVKVGDSNGEDGEEGDLLTMPDFWSLRFL